MATKARLLAGLLVGITSMANAQEFYVGADLSYVNELEDCSAIYRDRSGIPTDPYQLLGTEGADIARLRLWHNPEWTDYSNLQDVKKSIQRARSAGMAVLLDFHYSDFWADPGRQWKPDAWDHITDDSLLADSVYQYTYKTLWHLHNEGLLPEMVQIGNETNGNILISRNGAAIDSESPGLYPVNWSRQVLLFNSALQAVKDIELALEKNIKTVIHVADPLSATSWFQSAAESGLSDFDIIGLSYYPQWHNLGVRQVGDYVASLGDQFDKHVMIVETGYPWTANSLDQANNVLNYNSRLFTYSNTFSVETQREFLIELSWLVKENGGLGVIYWEPTWVSTNCQTYWSTGSHFENAALFDFDGNLHIGADFLSYDYHQKPSALNDQQVTFKVDMSYVNTNDGVFVTGDFTGSNWAFMPMTNTTGSVYQLETTIPGRSSGAYIFYNNNNWSDDFREDIQGSCALYWNSHRAYWVQGTSAEFYHAWSRCDQVPNVPLQVDDVDNKISIYPTLIDHNILIQSTELVLEIKIIDTSGMQMNLAKVENGLYDLSHLPAGLYLLKIQTTNSVFTKKLIKR